MTTVATVAVLVVLFGLYASWTAGRLDRLHARVDAAWAALDAQLVRRAAAARALAPHLPPEQAAALDEAAHTALEAQGPVGRELVENDLSRALRAVLPAVHDATPAEKLASEELVSAATRVGLARSFYNTAVQDTRSVRLRRIPRALRLAGHRAMPEYFEIDDTALSR